ncbi:MAG: hypothetical protein ABUT20_43520 [Bacteroidota bacterium]
MKSLPQKVHYFSAYPLKALNLPEEEYQSEIRLRSSAVIPSPNRIRVLPMVNPYREKDFLDEMTNDTGFQSDRQH